MKKITFLAVALALALAIGNFVVVAETNPLAGKIIALDAGHGGTSLGAQYPAGCADDGDPSDCLIYEKDVNLAVAYQLKAQLETNYGAQVVLTRKCDETVGLKERGTIANADCQALYGRKCDVLLSLHHNGNTDATHDGTLVIYNGRTDKTFATYMHNALISGLRLPDEGYLWGGYGMTIFGNFVSALTESYYITNTVEANANLAGTSTIVCQNTDGSPYSVLIGTRTQQEVDAQIAGLSNYFASQTSGGSGGNGKGRNK